MYFLKNFKGLKSIGGSQGVDRFMGANLKLSHIACPFFSTLLIEPFLFGSLLLARNYGQLDQPLKDQFRASAGFGLSWQIYPLAVELYYTLGIKAQNKEVRSALQFNIGID